MASASACARPTGEECFNDVEQRAGPVSPSNYVEAARPTVTTSRRLRSRIPARATQRREAAIRTISQQPTAPDEVRVRDSETRRWRRRAQSGEAATAGDPALPGSARGVRRRDFGTPRVGHGEVRGATGGVDHPAASSTPARQPGIVSRGALELIRMYQRLVSPSLGPVCRYEPSCSHFTYEAIERHGVIRGSWLGLKRLLRCRPMGGRGYDPVPD